MALLIDGYNLLHATDIFGQAGPGSDLHRSRLALLNFLARSLDKRERAETTIVFDAAGAPPGLPKLLHHDGITVHFAPRHSDADEMIEQLVEDCLTPRALTVVSGDRRVQRAARHRGATYIESAQWYANLLAAGRSKELAEQPPAKPTSAPPPEEVDYWLRQFNAPRDEDQDDRLRTP